MKKVLAVSAMCLSLASCGGNPDDAKRVLSQQGMTDIKIEGYAFWGCASGKNGDTFASNFSATARDGTKVTGAVCGGFLKGYTVRYY